MNAFSSKTACVTTRKMKISEKFLDEFSMICQSGLSSSKFCSESELRTSQQAISKTWRTIFWHSLYRILRFYENLRIQHGPSTVIFFSVCQWNISISWATFYSEIRFIAIDTTILSWSRLATTLDIPIRITSYVLSGVALFPFATPLCIDSCKKCYSKKFHRKNFKKFEKFGKLLLTKGPKKIK